uniref:Zinc finger protein n=1 Tax=Steinernema glaseri TaxID=37863 RepID=A0A1I8ASE4_9BILA
MEGIPGNIPPKDGDSPEEGAVRCQACFFEYESTIFLLNHLRAAANDEVHKDAKIECTHCSQLFPSIRNFLKHVDRVHKSWKSNALCTYGEQESPQRALTTQKLRSSAKKCKKCGKEFKKTSDFNRHLASHSREKTHVCTVCGARFGLDINLGVHMKIHKEKEQFPCTLCHKEYLSMSALKLHLRSHTNETPLVCEYPRCNKSFRTSKMRRDHVKREHNELVKKIPKASTVAEKSEIIAMLTKLTRSGSPAPTPRLKPSDVSAFSNLQEKQPVVTIVLDPRSLLVKIQPYFVDQNAGPNVQLSVFINFRLLENLSQDGLNLRIPLNFDMFPAGASLLIDAHSTLSQFAYPLSQYSVIAQPIPEGNEALLNSDCSLVLRVPAHVSTPTQYLVNSSLHEGNVNHPVAFAITQLDYEPRQSQQMGSANYWSFTPIDDLMFFPASPCDNEIASLMNRSSSIVPQQYREEGYYQTGTMGILQGNSYGRFTSAN